MAQELRRTPATQLLFRQENMKLLSSRPAEPADLPKKVAGRALVLVGCKGCLSSRGEGVLKKGAEKGSHVLKGELQQCETWKVCRRSMPSRSTGAAAQARRGSPLHTGVEVQRWYGAP